ncbi:hypothetical protein CYMTET_44834 [Cymbomonas tetramitiformis]|uniref:AB hydrolase-1 domain-containing protein n=1 Tax=Cymbomonas tetramitiformis TaxID=36881 RepID=A0AAE0BZG5_9CHLO|nr:hypothetical protein CYMTET_44834 [Cymbomonas tetramitiformis]
MIGQNSLRTQVEWVGLPSVLRASAAPSRTGPGAPSQRQACIRPCSLGSATSASGLSNSKADSSGERRRRSSVSTRAASGKIAEKDGANLLVGDHMAAAVVGIPPGVDSMLIERFSTENGDELENVLIAYSTYGTLNADGSNGVIVGHSLTSNCVVHEWWGEMMGECVEDGKQFALDPTTDFMVCANYCGSPYGSTSPVTEDTRTGQPFGGNFPLFTMRDQVNLQKILLEKLGVKHLTLAIGGSMGSMLALEWVASYPEFVDQAVLIAGCGRHTDWAIGMGEVQRQAIAMDSNYKEGQYEDGSAPTQGLAAARMMAMLSYRAPTSVDEKFGRSPATVKGASASNSPTTESATASTPTDAPAFAVESYLRYQGEKFIKRFDANCYLQLTRTLDTHNVARGRGEYDEVLGSVDHRALVVGIDSDMLYPLKLQEELAAYMPNAQLHTIRSPHGHDSFLIEIESLNDVVARFRSGVSLSAAEGEVAELLGSLSSAADREEALAEALVAALQRAESAEGETQRLYGKMQSVERKMRVLQNGDAAEPASTPPGAEQPELSRLEKRARSMHCKATDKKDRAMCSAGGHADVIKISSHMRKV